MLAELAQSYDDDARHLEGLDNDLSRELAAEEGMPTPGELAAHYRAMAYQVATMQQIHAEANRAHDAMIAAGGQDNAEAYTEYRETMERLQGLMPDFKKPELGT